MAIVQQYNCDSCGEILGGVSGTAVVKKTYIQIKGQVLMEFWDTKNNVRSFFYVTDRANADLTFCDPKEKPCLTDYIEMKRKMWEDKARTRFDAGAKRVTGFNYNADKDMKKIEGTDDGTSIPDPGWD